MRILSFVGKINSAKMDDEYIYIFTYGSLKSLRMDGFLMLTSGRFPLVMGIHHKMDGLYRGKSYETLF